METILSCNRVVTAFSDVVELPEEIAPDYKVFLRSHSNHALVRANEIYDDGYPWWDAPLPEAQ